ncbi:uncharacterized protein LOC113208326 [Frankliniella occidentalis]|uniref:Uncharacterized protein LOC113208326 n=1 Tax=Frankliniella occidentalis TaxID=133901 RepID=A0A6J1SJY1_FRAOC|nr:uncharacterized protein LOC113208326 [Frankliniella occidentalis]
MKCKYCKVSVNSFKSYKVHHSIDHANQPFMCPNESCGRTYGVAEYRNFLKHDCSGLSSNLSCASSNHITPSLTFALHDSSNLEHESDQSSNNASSHSGQSSNDFLKNMISDTDIFVSKLYCKPKLPRQYVQDIVSDCNSFVNNSVLSNVKNSLLTSMTLDCDQIKNVETIFSEYANPFSHLSTEYRRFKYFESNGDYIPPVPHKIGEVDISVKTSNGPVLKTKDCFVQCVPLGKVLKKFLEIPGCLNEILSYMNSVNANVNSKQNFIQCELWKTKRSKFSEGDIVLPLHCYFDEVESNNPLGSHTDKLGAVYHSIPCLPEECQESTVNIFLGLLFESWMRDFGDEKVFQPLIDELISLETNGILIDTLEGPKRIYFVTGLLLGDNLGLNSLGGFVECFTSNFFCRFCKTHRKVTTTMAVEDKSTLRTVQSYNDDVALSDYSVTGIKTNSVFNQLNSFHITSNFAVDGFHDLSEGVAHYVMLHVLKHCIPTYFTIEELNHRIALFQYGPCDSNKMPQVSTEFSARHKLKMSGSETVLFVKLFGLLVGDRVPLDDEYWHLYLKLVELFDICLSKNVATSLALSLNVIVSEFNSMYVKVTGDTLKAKFHHLVHYGTVFDQSGPITGMSTKSFERKHRSLTIPLGATESRRNIALTAAIQHQLNLCHRFKSRTSLLPETELGPSCEVLLDDFNNQTFLKLLPKCMRSSSELLSPSWLNLKGTRYKSGMVLLLDISKTGGPVLGVVESILNCTCHDDFVFVFSYLTVLGLNEHVHAYEVQTSDNWSCIKPVNLYDPLPLNIYHSVCDKKYVILRYML